MKDNRVANEINEVVMEESIYTQPEAAKTPKDSEWWDNRSEAIRCEIKELINGLVITKDIRIRRALGDMLGNMIGMYKDSIEAATSIETLRDYMD